MDHKEFRTSLDQLADWCLAQDAEAIQREYNKDDLMNMSLVFIHVAGNLAFDFYRRNGMLFDEMYEKHGAFGSAIRQMLIEHTGIDVAETYDNALDSDVLDGE